MWGLAWGVDGAVGHQQNQCAAQNNKWLLVARPHVSWEAARAPPLAVPVLMRNDPVGHLVCAAQWLMPAPLHVDLAHLPAGQVAHVLHPVSCSSVQDPVW